MASKQHGMQDSCLAQQVARVLIRSAGQRMSSTVEMCQIFKCCLNVHLQMLHVAYLTVENEDDLKSKIHTSLLDGCHRHFAARNSL